MIINLEIEETGIYNQFLIHWIMIIAGHTPLWKPSLVTQQYCGIVHAIVTLLFHPSMPWNHFGMLSTQLRPANPCTLLTPCHCLSLLESAFFHVLCTRPNYMCQFCNFDRNISYMRVISISTDRNCWIAPLLKLMQVTNQ